jgi:hypothetical protein
LPQFDVLKGDADGLCALHQFRLAREFATGGGREAAAGIDQLPAEGLQRFVERFRAAFRARQTPAGKRNPPPR